MSRTVEIKILPDGTGRVRIHWFQVLDGGPIKMPSGTIETQYGPLIHVGPPGRIACQPERTSVLPQEQNGVTLLTCHSDEPRAVTCPECMATPEFKIAMQKIAELLDISAIVAGVPQGA